MHMRVRNTGIRPKSEGRVTLGPFPVNDLSILITTIVPHPHTTSPSR